MNVSGILVGIGSFAIIGIFHPIVIKTEYHFISNIAISSLMSVLGFTLFWSIKELFEQEVRVSKGWYPKKPKKQSKPTGSDSN